MRSKLQTVRRESVGLPINPEWVDDTGEVQSRMGTRDCYDEEAVHGRYDWFLGIDRQDEELVADSQGPQEVEH
jgi:hypothetical protein